VTRTGSAGHAVGGARKHVGRDNREAALRPSRVGVGSFFVGWVCTSQRVLKGDECSLGWLVSLVARGQARRSSAHARWPWGARHSLLGCPMRWTGATR
jgi:hypothetical protein